MYSKYIILNEIYNNLGYIDNPVNNGYHWINPAIIVNTVSVLWCDVWVVTMIREEWKGIPVLAITYSFFNSIKLSPGLTSPSDGRTIINST